MKIDLSFNGLRDSGNPELCSFYRLARSLHAGVGSWNRNLSGTAAGGAQNCLGGGFRLRDDPVKRSGSKETFAGDSNTPKQPTGVDHVPGSAVVGAFKDVTG